MHSPGSPINSGESNIYIFTTVEVDGYTRSISNVQIEREGEAGRERG